MNPGAPPAAKAKALNCPNCGASLQVRGMGRSISIVCIQCLSVLDATDPNLQILSRFSVKERIPPTIPLGTRGKMRGDLYEVIGFQVRTIVVDGVEYSWNEYVLFNPFKGYRYLSEYQGHWNDVIVLKGVPEGAQAKGKPAVKYLGTTYRHFQTAQASTTYVMGEFPWQVRVGDSATTNDYVSPPQMISSEATEGEITWSLGEYTPGAQIWQAFQLPGSPPPPIGVFSNQPSPHSGKTKKAWMTYGMFLAAWFVLLILIHVILPGNEVYKHIFTFDPSSKTEASLVTETFELKGPTTSVEIDTHTSVDNSWVYISYALINETSGQAWDFGREISYYHGRDSDGSWSEGGANDSAVLPSIPAGRYYLRIEPETDTASTTTTTTTTAAEAAASKQSVRYEVRVLRGVPTGTWFTIAFLLLLIPPILITIRGASFEGKRWAESDYGGSSSSED